MGLKQKVKQFKVAAEVNGRHQRWVVCFFSSSSLHLRQPSTVNTAAKASNNEHT
jgi:hypothetical protein